MTTLRTLTEHIRLDSHPVRILGTRLTATMAAVRLGDGGVLLYSPVPLTAERRAAVEALGPVRHLYAPNLYHHLSIEAWAAALPDATVHAPPGLERKRPALSIDRRHGAPGAPFDDALLELPIEGCRLGEAALFHRPSGTLLLADLVHNIGRPSDRWTALYTRAMGFYDRVALSRMLRWTAFSDRRAARRSVDALLALPIERVVVGHGAPIEENARARLAAAFDWLPG